MYGTDLQADPSESADEVKNSAHERWTKDWKYLTTKDSLESPFVNGKFKGLHLPKKVIDKIFYKNAEKWYFTRAISRRN